MFRLAMVTSVAALLGLAVPEAAAQGGLTFQQAFAQAQKQVPGGQLTKARVEKGGSVYGFYFWSRGKLYEIEISRTGLLEKSTTSGGAGEGGSGKGKVSQDVLDLIEKQAKAKVKLPDGRLMEIAGEALKDTPFKELKYDKDGDKLVIKLDDKSVIDTETGKITPVEKKK